MDQLEILGVVSANLPCNVLPVVKFLLFLYFGLKMPHVICVDSDEVLGINFLSRILIHLLPVRCADIDDCLIQVFDEFLGIVSGAGATPTGALVSASAYAY